MSWALVCICCEEHFIVGVTVILEPQMGTSRHRGDARLPATQLPAEVPDLLGIRQIEPCQLLVKVLAEGEPAGARAGLIGPRGGMRASLQGAAFIWGGLSCLGRMP